MLYLKVCYFVGEGLFEFDLFLDFIVEFVGSEVYFFEFKVILELYVVLGRLGRVFF